MNAAQWWQREARAWRELTSEEYDSALCAMLDDLSAAAHTAEKLEALLALADATLRRHSATLTASRARCAEQLLAIVPAVPGAAPQLRIALLVLLAWLQLGAVAERGPESVTLTPELPAGVLLPGWVDPDDIADPVLRGRARVAAEQHRDTVERWNARQRALAHLHHLAALVRAARAHFADHDAVRELLTAMSLAPGLPPELRRSLEHDAE